jgi:hypothetical protein
MNRLKARLRAWLIDLVREAVRLELNAREIALAHDAKRVVFDFTRDKATVLASAPVEPIEPSFELLQEQAIQGQEKFYESA